ncbi:MAG TPA: hypothetical protein VGN73_11825, partial [Gemmatimonadaceae bacterium]|nr:hypothetical protein [Gemmatimonadaceae bacterium]
GLLWRLFRKAPTDPTPDSYRGDSSDSDPVGQIPEPRIGIQFGRGAAWDSVGSFKPPLITRSIELVPQIGTATSEIFGPPPSIEVINWEG